MKLQILVPHWQEDFEDIEPLLDSIAIQQGIDFNDISVIIAYDGPDATEIEYEKEYPFDIYQIRNKEKLGVSGCRNSALDHATAEYVMFCDADDMFSNVCAFFLILTEAQNSHFDTMVSVFIEESRMPETKQTVYINHDMDSTFVHGKVHRRQYLLDKKIRFNDKLTIHEDSYFNILCQNLTDKAIYCPIPFYLWKWRDASVCRHDPDYILKTYNNMLDSNDALVDEFQRRKRKDKAMFYCGFMIFDAYYTMNKKEWKDKTNKDYRDAVEVRFARYFKKHKKKWLALSEQDKMMISNGVRQRSVMEGMPMENITLDDWLARIETL